MNLKEKIWFNLFFLILLINLSDISKLGDPLEKFNKVIPWEYFRKLIEEIIPRKNKSSKGGRPSYDYILMFKILILQILYNLSDDKTEFQIMDKLSFMRFLDLSLTDKVPDAKTIWLFRENLGKNNGIQKLFDKFESILIKSGFLARSGKIIDASIIKAPTRQTGKKNNELIKKRQKNLRIGLNGRNLKKCKQIWMLDGQKKVKIHSLVIKIT